MSVAARLRAGVRSTLRGALSQEQRTELKRLQGVVKKRMSPVLSMVHGSFTTADLMANLANRIPKDFEILMVHSSFDGMLPMYKGNAKELVSALMDFCGPNRTLVMPCFVMGGRTYDTAEYFKTKPFDVRRTPSEMGLVAEVFRRTPKAVRSLHPTCSVCALGPLAQEMTAGHHVSRSGLSPDSPFGFMTRRKTAIIGLGVEYYRCLTHVHTASDAMGAEFPIKSSSPGFTPVKLIDYDGGEYEYKLGLPDRSNPNKKLDLTILWSVLEKGELVEWKFHGVPLFLVPRAGVLTERLIAAARKGITVYGTVPVENVPAAAASHSASK